MKQCTDCKESKELAEFYQSATHRGGVMCYCKECFNARCQQRWVQRKLKAIRYLGSQCKDCGLPIANSHYAVFEFHHLDATQKDANWTKMRLRSQKAIQAELDKCVLLCANCHRIRHAYKDNCTPKPQRLSAHV